MCRQDVEGIFINNEKSIKVRNKDSHLIANCKVNVGVTIGSYDCTANCPSMKILGKKLKNKLSI
jgi:hypothetical protein